MSQRTRSRRLLENGDEAFVPVVSRERGEVAVSEFFHYQSRSLAVIFDAEDFLGFHGTNSLQLPPHPEVPARVVKK